jgi:hypothetical protein
MLPVGGEHTRRSRTRRWGAGPSRPALTDDELHERSIKAANVFVRLEPQAPDGLPQRWQRAYPNKMTPRVRSWVIIHNQLRQPPKMVQRVAEEPAAACGDVDLFRDDRRDALAVG